MAGTTLNDAVPSSPTLLTTLARARQSASLADLSDSDLTTLLQAAGSLLERVCHRQFARATATETYDGDGTNRLVLNRWPIESVASVTITDASGETTELDGSEFRVKSTAGIIEFKPDSTAGYTVFPEGFQNVSVTYTAGYDPMPDGIQEAVVEIAAWLYETNNRDLSAVSERLGDYSVTRDTGLPAFVERVIAAYRDWRTGS